MTVTVTENRVGVTTTDTGATVTPSTSTVSLTVASGLSQAAGDALYARLAAENAFTDTNTMPAVGIADGTPNDLPVGALSGTQYNLVSIVDTVNTLPLAHFNGYDGRFARGLELILNFDLGSGEDVTDSNAIGLNFTVNTVGAKAPRYLIGMQGAAQSTGAGSAPSMVGGAFYAYNLGAAAVDSVEGMYISADNYGAGSVTTLTGLHIEANFSSSGITTRIGLDIGDQAGSGATTTYALRTGTGPVRFGDYIEMPEITAPAAPATNNARLFVRDNGAGKSQLCVRFATGSVIVLATEP